MQTVLLEDYWQELAEGFLMTRLDIFHVLLHVDSDLKALEQREAELYWAVHEARYPPRPGDDVPETNTYDSMEALLADLALPE